MVRDGSGGGNGGKAKTAGQTPVFAPERLPRYNFPRMVGSVRSPFGLRLSAEWNVE